MQGVRGAQLPRAGGSGGRSPPEQGVRGAQLPGRGAPGGAAPRSRGSGGRSSPGRGAPGGAAPRSRGSGGRSSPDAGGPGGLAPRRRGPGGARAAAGTPVTCKLTRQEAWRAASPPSQSFVLASPVRMDFPKGAACGDDGKSFPPARLRPEIAAAILAIGPPFPRGRPMREAQRPPRLGLNEVQPQAGMKPFPARRDGNGFIPPGLNEVQARARVNILPTCRCSRPATRWSRPRRPIVG